ncbi:hypothetical protein [Paenibacillus amylolyticus]|uniref:hypothetical protein n=1 Tax=Paenibacillus amylolyticus TaxID=1451 RepID=UPI003879ED10
MLIASLYSAPWLENQASCPDWGKVFGMSVVLLVSVCVEVDESLAYKSRSFRMVGLRRVNVPHSAPRNEVVLRMRAIVNALKMTHAAAGIPQQHGFVNDFTIISNENDNHFCTCAIIFTQYNF